MTAPATPAALAAAEELAAMIDRSLRAIGHSWDDTDTKEHVELIAAIIAKHHPAPEGEAKLSLAEATMQKMVEVEQERAQEIAALRAECAALAGIVKGFLECPEIADCAPEDKDPATDEIERRARSVLTPGAGESALRCVRELIGIAENTSGMTAEIEADIATARRLFGTGDSK